MRERNLAPSSPALRISRCGERGPLSEPPPRSAPRKYAARQQARATTRLGGCSSGVKRELSTPASFNGGTRYQLHVAGDMKLVSRAAVEGAAPVGPDLRPDAERAQQAERAARHGGINDVEMDRDLAASLQMFTARGVKEPRKLGKPVARAPRRDRRELVA